MSNIFRDNGAKAIWKDHSKQQNRYVKFQTEFVADCEEVLFYICSDTQYELYINGTMVAFGQYGDYPSRKVYECINISPYINNGLNLVSILAFSNGKDSMCHSTGLPMLIFAAMSNNKCLLVSDDKVKCTDKTEFVSGEFENITDQLSYNFGFDLRNDDGFRNKNVSEKWDYAVICDDSNIQYSQYPIQKPLLKDICCGNIITQGEFKISDGDTVAQKMQYAYLSYRDKNDVMEQKDNMIFLKKDCVFWIQDLGKETAGYITLEVEASEGAIIDIAYGEHLSDMRVRSAIRTRNYAFRTICREGKQKIAFYIRRIAGRYLEIFASGGVRTIHTVGLHAAEYPLEYNELWLNDRLFNKIYEVSQRTLMLCMHEHYEDCPQREQALYGMDSRNQMLSGYYAFGETDMPRASLALLAQSQRNCGLLELVAPGSCIYLIPSFSLAWICAVNEYVLFSGDIVFAKEMLPVAKKIIDFFEIDEEKKIVLTPTGSEMWNFYEWTDGMNVHVDASEVRYDAPLNSFFMLALRSYEKLCVWTENEAEKAWAQKKIDMIYDGFHRAFYCEENKAYKTYIDGKAPHFAQLTQALALCSHCVPEEYQNTVRESITSDEFVESSLSHSVYKYDALMQDADKYADFVLSDIENKWGYMLYHGATTFWETILGESDFGGAGSLCHGWSAIPAYVFWRYILGIYPTSPGFKTMSAVPCCGNDFCAEGSLKTVNGTFKAHLDNGVTHIERINEENE